MSKDPPPLTDFADLRRVGIDYAQEASGTLWTDFNLHDPGVTLLEQTCFALSQLAYQTAFPPRDLLTTPQGDFQFNEIGFAQPRKVLRTAPVTRDDLERWLNECADIEGVRLEPRGESHPGLYDMVIFGDGKPAPTLEAEMRTAFDRIRPLGTALGKVTVAQRVNVFLQGTVEIVPGAQPNTVAAEIYNTVRNILSGQAIMTEAPKGATRRDVFDAPERLFHAPQRGRVPKLLGDTKTGRSRSPDAETEISLASNLGLIRELSDVQEIETLSLRLCDPENRHPPEQPYLYVVLPNVPSQNHLTLTVDGAPMLVNPARLREDYVRIRAAHIAQSHHHIDSPDWDVLKPGRRRSFDLSHVDALLPGLYQAAGHRPEDDPAPLLAQYRSLIDGVLQDMGRALGNLPETFLADGKRDPSDPVIYRAQLDLLDYLISLQGVEMPVTRHTGLHSYRGTVARHRFELSWRLLALSLLPELNATRATAPGIEGPGGFLASLALLCDLDLAGTTSERSVLERYGLRLADGAPLSAHQDMLEVSGDDDVNMLDLLPVEDPDAQPYDPETFAKFLPFIDNNTLCPTHFHRLVLPEAIRVVPAESDKWLVVVDLGDVCPPWPVAVIGTPDRKGSDPRKEAFLCAARLRATWRLLHRQSETVRLLEPFADPARAGTLSPFTAVLLVPGWTARGALASYRQYVEAQVARLAPAHIHVSVIWQNYVAPEQPAPVNAPDAARKAEGTE